MNTELSPPPPAGATHRPKGLRSTRWLAASIVALLLGAVGVAMVAAGFSRFQQGQWPAVVGNLAEDESFTWGNPLVVASACVLALLGLILLLTALLPGPKRSFAVASVRDGDVRINGSGIARLVEHRVDSLDGVSNVRAHLRRGRVAVQVATPLRETAQLRNRALAVARSVLEENLESPLPRITMQVRSLS